ncbi:MAG: peptidoglycan DD-metalloendopeptidase family protein [Pseudomonadota bacterium]|nr:peptidoglycan DD-metalloendopeptidase family protein [Pseudomonadota bacterium]
MPNHARFVPLSRAGLSVVAALLCAFTPLPAHARQSGKDRTEQAAAERKLADVRSRMEALARQQAATTARRDSLNAALARQANALASAARALHQTETALAAKQQQLAQLQQQRATLKQALAEQHAAIADLLRATYALGHGSDLRLLLGDQDVARISRALVYSRYFQQDRVRRVRQLMADLSRLQELEATISAEQQALQAAQVQRRQQTATLARQRAAQQKLAAEADAQYQDQAQRLAALKRHAASLDRLLDTLRKAIDAAAHEAARAEHAGRKPPSSALAVGSAAADIRGDLPWPANGVVNRYGNGVLIKARGGSEVHAVARGRVVYAGFLRGYGMLLILNHGNGWMSMYGDNETLLQNVGDRVRAGDPIGTASPPTAINTGVYFELRKDGKPVDPRHWLSQRH